MPWAKVDDKLHAHPKAEVAGLEALGLHLLAMSHCAAYGTDGHVSRSFVFQKAGDGNEMVAERLVESGLWEVNGSGWVIHDWLQYNLSRSQAKRLAKQKQAAGRLGGKVKANT